MTKKWGQPPAFAEPLPGSECPLPIDGQEPGTNDPITVHEHFHVGMYVVEVVSADGSARRGKLIVQH